MGKYIIINRYLDPSGELRTKFRVGRGPIGDYLRFLGVGPMKGYTTDLVQGAYEVYKAFVKRDTGTFWHAIPEGL